MSATDKHKIEDILINLGGKYLDIKHPRSQIFTSFNSKYLDSYINGAIDAEKFDTDDSLMGLNPEYITHYRRFLGFRHIHMGSLSITGGLTNPNADVTLCFDLSTIMEKPHLICEHDALFNLLLYGSETRVKLLFKENYSKYDEILVRKLDMKESKFILTGSSYAQEKTEQMLPQIPKYDIADIKKKISLNF